MDGVVDMLEEISQLKGVNSLVITDESGSPMEFPGTIDDDECSAITAFVGTGVNGLADILDLDDFKIMSMSHGDGAIIVCPVGDLYLGVMLSESRNLFKIETKINEILN